MHLVAEPITKENAREMALRSHVKRKAEMVRLRADSKELALLKSQLAQTSAHVSRAVRIEKQMDILEVQMRKTDDSKEFANLTAAYARLFDAWCILTGTQLPSKAKVSRRQAAAPIAPIESPTILPAVSPTPIDPTAPRSEDCTG